MAPCAKIPMLSREKKVHGCQKSKVYAPVSLPCPKKSPTTLLRSSPTMLLLVAHPPPRQPRGGTTIGIGGIAFDSRERAGRCYSTPYSGAPAPSCNPEPRANIDRRTPEETPERRENPPTPSSTNINTCDGAITTRQTLVAAQAFCKLATLDPSVLVKKSKPDAPPSRRQSRHEPHQLPPAKP